jgi:hypothetical protein
MKRLPILAAVILSAVSMGGGLAASQGSGPGPAKEAAKLGAKLSNPISDVWALFTELDLAFFDGDLNSGDPQLGGRMIFQPVLPFPLYGSGEGRWSIIPRPIIPILFSQPIAGEGGGLDRRGGLGDIQLPMMIAPPTGNLILGVGPTWLFPTSTNDAFGRHQWGAGPGMVVGHISEKLVAGVFPQYTFGIGSRRDRPEGVEDASYLSILYFLTVNLPQAWQVGMSPTIYFDRRAADGSRWNVPVGLLVAKTTHVGKLPVKFQLSAETSVVSEDAFGQRSQFRLNVIPVIPALMKRPMLGGGSRPTTRGADGESRTRTWSATETR